MRSGDRIQVNSPRSTSAQRVAAAQQRLVTARRRERLRRVVLPVAGVVVVLAALIVVKVAAGGGQPESGQAAQAAATTVTDLVTGVPASALDTVGVGAVRTLPERVTGAPRVAAGRPEVLYIGAEYCPYCAAERWAVAVALSRFGTFTGLGQTASSPSDVYPNTATLTFHGAAYRSDYLTLTAKETQSNQVVDGRYAPLDRLTPEQQQILSAQDPGGGIPFLDLGGRYVVSGASYDPQVLQGRTHEQIARALADPGSPVARAVDGTANVLTASLCELTGGQPAEVCTSTGVTAAAAALGSGHAG